MFLNSKKTAFCGLFSLFFNVFSHDFVDHGNWAMCKSSFGTNVHISGSHFDQLFKLGAQAHIISKDLSNHVELLMCLDENFKIVDNLFLIEVIEEILNSPEKLAKVTRDSYRNVLGFLKLVLMSNGKNSWKIRIHVWEGEGTEDLHNHKWNFFSKVIAGSLTQNLYEIGNEFNSISYTVHEPVSLMPLLADGCLPCPCRDDYSLQLKNSDYSHVNIFKKSTTIINRGFSYFMKAPLIHTIDPTKDAVTFVFTTEQLRENSEVFLPAFEEVQINRNAPSVSSEDVVVALHKLKEQLTHEKR